MIAMPTHQAFAASVSPRTGAPVNNPRSDSMIGVNGWYSANWRIPGPILSAGTIALLRNGNMISGTAAKPADSAVLAASPIAMVNQLTANTVNTRMPITASHSPNVADGRKPSAKATPRMADSAITVRTTVHRRRGGAEPVTDRHQPHYRAGV